MVSQEINDSVLLPCITLCITSVYNRCIEWDYIRSVLLRITPYYSVLLRITLLYYNNILRDTGRNVYPQGVLVMRIICIWCGIVWYSVV